MTLYFRTEGVSGCLGCHLSIRCEYIHTYIDAGRMHDFYQIFDLAKIILYV